MSGARERVSEWGERVRVGQVREGVSERGE